MSKTEELRKVIAGVLSEACPRINYEVATDTEAFPYLVYDLASIDLDKIERDDVILTIDIWDKSISPATVEEMADRIIQFIMPALQGILQTTADIVSGLIRGILRIVINVIQSIIDTFNFLTDYLNNVFSVAWESGLQMLISIFVSVWNFFKTVFLSVKNIFTELIAFIQNVFAGDWEGAWQNVMNIFASVWTLINAPVEAAKGILRGMLNFVRDVFVAVWRPVWQTVMSIFISIWNRMREPVNRVKGILQELISFVRNVFTKNWRGAWQNVVNIFSSIWGSLKGAVKRPLNSVISIINRFISGLNKLKIPDWVPDIGGKGIHISAIPMLAQGGEIVKAGRVIVGDAGPEMLDLPVGAKVTPLRNGSGFTSDEEVIRILELLLAELKELGSNLYDTILDALVNGTKIDWNNRNYSVTSEKRP